MPKSKSQSRAQGTYVFALVLADVPAGEDSLEDALFESGCDDALLGSRDGVWFLDFERSAPSLLAAVVAAVTDVSKADLGIRIDRVEPDDWVTASEIARRTERSRESVRQLIHAERGPGGFPPPIANVKRRSPLWRWSEVVEWFREGLNVGVGRGDEARDLAMINAALALQRNLHDVELLNRLWSAGGSRYEIRTRKIPKRATGVRRKRS